MRTTFGALAIGDRFWWRDTKEIKNGPRGPEPMTKTSADRYGWSKGTGTAEAHYPVTKIARKDSMPLMRRGSAKQKHEARHAWLSARPELILGVPGLHDDVDDVGRGKLDALVDQLLALGFLGSKTHTTHRETVGDS